MSKMSAEYQKQRESISNTLFDLYESGELDDIAQDWIHRELSIEEEDLPQTFIEFLNIRLEL